MKEENYLETLIAYFPKKSRMIIALLLLIVGAVVFIYTQTQHQPASQENTQVGDGNTMNINN